YGTLVAPVPSPVPLVAGTRVPNVSLQVPGLVVAMRNQPVVASPFGLPDPFSDADVLTTDVAADVAAVGAAAAATLAVPSTSATAAARSSRTVVSSRPRLSPKLVTLAAQIITRIRSRTRRSTLRMIDCAR